jgi:hypothetical protein
MSVVSLRLASYHSSFGEGVRFLSRIAVDGEVSMVACSYGTGVMYVEFTPVPGISDVWVAINALAFALESDSDGFAFVASWCVNHDNARAFALDRLIEAVTKA